MKLEITADFDIRELEQAIQDTTDQWFDELVDTLREKGKKYTTMARAKTKSEGGFGNITWNLRSSIGYCLVYEGKIVESYFPPIKNGTVGQKVGQDMAEKLAVYGGEEVALVLVAGMDYGVFVERKGWDVLTMSSTKFRQELESLWRDAAG